MIINWIQKSTKIVYSGITDDWLDYQRELEKTRIFNELGYLKRERRV